MTDSHSRLEQRGFRCGDKAALTLTDEWCGMLGDYRELGGNTDLLKRCRQLRSDGVRAVEGTIVHVNIPLDKSGYGHYAIRCPLLGVEPIDVAHEDLEPSSRTSDERHAESMGA